MKAASQCVGWKKKGSWPSPVGDGVAAFFEFDVIDESLEQGRMGSYLYFFT